MLTSCCCAIFPRPHDDLWRGNERTHLINHRHLEFSGRDSPDGAGLWPPFDHLGGNVIAIQPFTASGVGRREGKPVRPEQQSLEQSWRVLPASVGRAFAWALLQDRVDPFPQFTGNDRLMLTRIAHSFVD